MSRRAALVTQADIRRAVKVAKEIGGFSVEVRADGSLLLRPDEKPPQSTVTAIEPRRRIVL